MSSLALYVLLVAHWVEGEGIGILEPMTIYNTLEECQQDQSGLTQALLPAINLEQIAEGKVKVLCIDTQFLGDVL